MSQDKLTQPPDASGLVQMSDEALARELELLFAFHETKQLVLEAARRLRAASLEARRMPDLEQQRRLLTVAEYLDRNGNGLYAEYVRAALAGHVERPATECEKCGATLPTHSRGCPTLWAEEER